MYRCPRGAHREGQNTTSREVEYLDQDRSDFSSANVS